MKIYLVGGAVRDQLLGIPILERDWVVVGATPAQMTALGYKQVGKDFPVFLHPETKEEYALARTERKTGPGYYGFITDFSDQVTLEMDLSRRDLTINAMAISDAVEFIDPYHGKDDLDARLLRHVSPAFVEDPVRVLRVARFAARFAKWGFHLAHSTHQLMKKMVESGEVDHLVPERVWVETLKALHTHNPEKFFKTLHASGALEAVYPELSPLFGPHQSHQSLAEGELPDALAILGRATTLFDDPALRLVSLLQCLAMENNKLEPDAGAKTLARLARRIRMPKEISQLATLAIRYREVYLALDAQTSAEKRLTLLENVDCFRRKDRFQNLLQVWESNDRTSPADPVPAATLILQKDANALENLAVQSLLDQGLAGQDFADELRKLRLEKLNENEVNQQ